MVRITPLAASAAGAAAVSFILRSSVPAATAGGKPSLTLVSAVLAFCFCISGFAITAIVSGKKRTGRLGVLAISFSAGALIGIASADRPASTAFWGIGADRVQGATARIISDSRLLKDGGRMVDIEPLSACASGGIRTSASGKITAIFPARTDPILITRGATVQIQGKVAEGRFGPLFKAASASPVREAPPAERTRALFRENLATRLAKATSWGGLALALLMGSKDGLERGESQAYTEAGCAHVLALSGMHLALISALLAFLLKPILGLKPAALAGFVFIILYVYMAGSQPSITRAAIMYALVTWALLNDLPRDLPTVLGAAFLIQLVMDPEGSRSVSFILSYLALAGIALLSKPADDLMKSWLPDFIRPALAASIAAFIATAAVSAHFFGSLRPVGIIASLALSPMANIIMLGAVFWLVLSAIHPCLGLPFDWILTRVDTLNTWILKLAAGVKSLATPSVPVVLIISLAALFFLVYGHSARNRIRNRFDPIN